MTSRWTSSVGIWSRAWLVSACSLATLTVPAVAFGDTPSSLRWGADQEGGGPYVFPREDKPTEVTGFEVDLAAAIARRLQLRSEFTQAQWDKLPDMLRTHKVDLVLNGYELTPEREAEMTPTLPYYAYALDLLARKDDPRIARWEDLSSAPGGKRLQLGVLTGSAAETYAKELCAPSGAAGCDVHSYDGNTDSMREVETGKLDATVQDTPIASFYASSFPRLHSIGEPRRKGYYVGYLEKGNEAQKKALDEALVDIATSGELEKIDRAYGIWDARQQEIIEIARSARFFGVRGKALDPKEASSEAETQTPPPEGQTAPARKHGWEVVKAYSSVLLQSAGLTILLAVASFPLAILLGLGIAIGRMYGPRWLAALLTVYVELLRGTPVMLQLYFIFFFLPELGVTIPALACGILGLALNYSAYESEIYRAGLQAVPAGQMEAALALGMSRSLALRKVIVPQAARIVIPPVVNDFIALFKDTSVCSVITLIELTKRFSVLSQSTQATIELMGMTAVLYLAMSYPMSLLAQRLERRLGLVPAV